VYVVVGGARWQFRYVHNFYSLDEKNQVAKERLYSEEKEKEKKRGRVGHKES
jgi:hypothetical protein